MASDTSINVVDPNGALVSIPAEQFQDAVQEGFRAATPTDITEYKNQQQYGEGLENVGKAAAAGALRGATFGASDVALPKLGVTTKEALHQRAERNPISTHAGELAGVGVSLLLAPEASPAGLLAKTGEAVSEIAPRLIINPETATRGAKILAGATDIGAKSLGSAVEGAAYGLGNEVSEHALGDPDIHGENLLHNVGYGALFGGGLGATLGLGQKVFSKELQHAVLSDSIAENTIARAPESLSALKSRVEGAELPTELTAKPALINADQLLGADSKFPVHELQAQSLESLANRAYYKTLVESDSEEGRLLRDYEALQKHEGTQLTKQYVDKIAPGSTEDAVQGGERAVKSFSDQYKAEKKSLEPFFKEFDKKAINFVDKPEEIVIKLQEAIPEAGEYIQKTPDGYEIAKFKKSMPFSENTYGALKDFVDVLNEPSLTIRDLRNLRESMRDRVNFLSAPRDSSQITELRKSLMDIIQQKVQELSPDLPVREAFQKYAVNEQNREIMERIFGGSINNRASFAKEITPEDVLNKIFSNTVSVKAAKAILGTQFDKITANYLAQKIGTLTDAAKNGFSSSKFASFLRNKFPELQEAINPEILQKFQAIADKMRILPDSPSINPSGTAKALSIMAKLQNLSGFLSPQGLIRKGLSGIIDKFQQSQQRDFIDKILSGEKQLGNEAQLTNKHQQYDALAKIERMGQDMTNTIKSKVGKIFKSGGEIAEDTSKSLGGAVTPEEQQKKYAKTEKQIKTLTANLDISIDSHSEAVQDLQGIAPSIASSLVSTTSKATQFLASKLPAQDPSSPMSEPYKPSPAELSKFNRYKQIVDSPSLALDQVRTGTLVPESIETLNAVYPKLYTEMKMQMMDKITKKLDSLPYQTKLMLSMFLQQDMTNSLKQINIASSQLNTEPGQEGAVKPSGKELGKINQSNQLLTASQKATQRKDT